MNQGSAWLFSRKKDLLWLFIPVWATWILAFALPRDIIHQEVSFIWWLFVVVGIDVSHVWTTIFRTYLDREEFKNHRWLLIGTPLLCFTAAFLVSFWSIALFWRILAYVAVFHFVKQQYGFMRIYKAKSQDFKKRWIPDNAVIYLTMLYPILFWHLNDDRAFHWFAEGDFLVIDFSIAAELINTIGKVAYFLILIAWLVQEIVSGQKFIVGKILWTLTTAGNWYLGIVYFNSDLVFTITNVVAHGIPYFALILFYQNKKRELNGSSRRTSPLLYAFLVIGVVLVLAIGEEFFWEIWVNQEQKHIFGSMPYSNTSSHLWFVFATALLSVPQMTHYVVDGFIWKSGSKNPHLEGILLGR